MFLNKLTDHSTSVGYLSGNNLLCGDFNLNMHLPTNESTRLKNLLEAFGRTITNNFYLTINKCKKATYLDVFFLDFECSIHVQDYSDHGFVNLKMPTSLTMNTENGLRSRNRKKFEREDLKLFFNYNLNVALYERKQNSQLMELNSAFNLFNSVLETTLDIFLPLKFNKTNMKHRDWIDNNVKKATKSTQQFWLRYKKEPTLTNFLNWKRKKHKSKL